MKAVLNVLSKGLALSMSLSLLAACSDGRGMGGFKSYRSTPEEREAWLAKNQPVSDEVSELDGVQGDDNVDTHKDTLDPEALGGGEDSAAAGTSGSSDQQKDTATGAGQSADDQKASSQDLSTDSQDTVLRDFETEEAKAQVLSELGQEPAAESEQQKVAKQADLVVANDAELGKGENLTAKDLVKGITFDVKVQNGVPFLSLDAVVTVDKEDMSLHVAHAAIKITQDGETTNLPVALKVAKTGEDRKVGDKVYVVANCREEACTQIQVRMEFNLESGARTAAVFLLEVIDSIYQLRASNINNEQKTVATFQEAYEKVGGAKMPKDMGSDGVGAASSFHAMRVKGIKAATAKSSTTTATPATGAGGNGAKSEAKRPFISADEMARAAVAAKVPVSAKLAAKPADPIAPPPASAEAPVAPKVDGKKATGAKPLAHPISSPREQTWGQWFWSWFGY